MLPMTKNDLQGLITKWPFFTNVIWGNLLQKGLVFIEYNFVYLTIYFCCS